MTAPCRLLSFILVDTRLRPPRAAERQQPASQKPTYNDLLTADGTSEGADLIAISRLVLFQNKVVVPSDQRFGRAINFGVERRLSSKWRRASTGCRSSIRGPAYRIISLTRSRCFAL